MTNNPKVLLGEDERVALKQDIDQKQLWSGAIFPNKAGWHQLREVGDSESVYDFLVVDSTQWRAKRHYETTTSNNRMFTSQESTEILEDTFLKGN